MKNNCEIIYKGIKTDESYEKTIKKVVSRCFEIEDLDKTNLYMSITLTNLKEIQTINRVHRNIDKATDVLSFPMFEKEELEKIIDGTNNIEDILGDIIIAIPKVQEQADEYGHSFERELSYMVVHGFYHLMGYDHMVDDDKKVMREKEEGVLKSLNISRDYEKEDKLKENKYEIDTKLKEEKENRYEDYDKNSDAKEKVEDKSIKNNNFADAWKNAFNGIIYATTTQSNIKKQLIIAVAVVIISLFFELSKAEFLCFMFTIVLIIFAEMVNTAIETVVDLYVDVYHPKAKIAKDVAAGGVVITTINAIIVAYFLFFDKLSNLGIGIIKNVANSPVHLAFATIIITVIGILALIAIAVSSKNKDPNKSFVPSGHAAIAFAANTIIWISTTNPVIITLSLVLSLLVAESRIASKEHKLSEVVFSACISIILVLIIYGLISLVK